MASKEIALLTFEKDPERGDHEIGGAPKSTRSARRRRTSFRILLVVSCIVLSVLHYRLWSSPSVHLEFASDLKTPSACPQAAPINPVAGASVRKDLEVEYASETFKLQAYESLGGAVRIPYVPTVCMDDRFAEETAQH